MQLTSKPITGHPVHAQIPQACPLKLTIARTDLLRQWRVRCLGNFPTTKNRSACTRAGERRRIWYNGGLNPKEDGVTTYTFRIVVEPDEDRWRAYAPALEAEGPATWGYTREEALANIREVLEMIVGELAEEGRPVPADVAVSEEPLVAVTV
jgi:predicted RNase H-like HicB family nuclease